MNTEQTSKNIFMYFEMCLKHFEYWNGKQRFIDKDYFSGWDLDLIMTFQVTLSLGFFQ